MYTLVFPLIEFDCFQTHDILQNKHCALLLALFIALIPLSSDNGYVCVVTEDPDTIGKRTVWSFLHT